MTTFEMPDPRPYNEPFWEAAADGRLVVQHCTACGYAVYPPRSGCPECFADLEWVNSDGRATLYSYTVVHHPDPPEALAQVELPFLGCVAELEEGVRIASHLVGCDSADVTVGMDLAVTFGETPDGRSIPKFEPA